MSDQPQQPDQPTQPTESRIPAGQPITSPPAVLSIEHPCEQCGHANTVTVKFGGVLVPVQPPPRVAVAQGVTPADVDRLRRGPTGIVR